MSEIPTGNHIRTDVYIQGSLGPQTGLYTISWQSARSDLVFRPRLEFDVETNQRTHFNKCLVLELFVSNTFLGVLVGLIMI